MQTIRGICLWTLLVIAALSGCSQGDREVVVIIHTCNDLSTERFSDRSIEGVAEEFDLQLVFGDSDKSISTWSSRVGYSPALELEEWDLFQEEVQLELEDRFGVRLRAGLSQDEFVEALRATLELAQFRQISGISSTWAEGERDPDDLDTFQKQEWLQETAIYRR